MSNLEIKNTVEGEAWVVTFKGDNQPRAVVARKQRNQEGNGTTIVLKGEGYSNFIAAADHDIETCERVWPPLNSDIKLDPLPYVIYDDYDYEKGEPGGIILRGETRRDLARFGLSYFRPREQYQQIEVYYLWDQRIDPKPWRYALFGDDPEKQAREAEQMTGGFVFDPRPTYSQDRSRYDVA